MNRPVFVASFALFVAIFTLVIPQNRAVAQSVKPNPTIKSVQSIKSSVKFFDFNDPKGMNAVSLTINSLIEPVIGYADGISGNALFDPAKPEATTGKIIVQANTVSFTNPGYTQTARNYALNANKYPEIVCELKKIGGGKVVRPGVYEGTVAVDFTCHGVTKALIVPLQVTYLPGISKQRYPDFDGDLLIVRCNFAIKRSDFGIAKEAPPASVSDEIQVRVAIVGTEKKAAEVKAIQK